MTLKYTVGTPRQVFSYNANLANNTTAEPTASPPLIWDMSGQYDRDLFANFELTGQWAATPTGVGWLRIWLLPSRDPSGTTYPEGSSTFTPLIPSQLNFPVAALTTVQTISISISLLLAPTKYKILIHNEGGSQANNATTPMVLRAFTWGVTHT